MWRFLSTIPPFFWLTAITRFSTKPWFFEEVATETRVNIRGFFFWSLGKAQDFRETSPDLQVFFFWPFRKDYPSFFFKESMGHPYSTSPHRQYKWRFRYGKPPKVTSIEVDERWTVYQTQKHFLASQGRKGTWISTLWSETGTSRPKHTRHTRQYHQCFRISYLDLNQQETVVYKIPLK